MLGLVPRRLPRAVLAAAGVTLLAVALAVTVWPGIGSEATTGAAPRQQAVVAADALQAATALRAEEKASRGQARSPYPSIPITYSLDVVGHRWATAHVNIRSGPAAGDDRVAVLKAGSRAAVTGVTFGSWTQLVIDGRAGWVRSSYLVRSKPKPKPKAATTPAGVSGAACSISPSIESHLTANARSVYRAVCAAYGSSVSSFGGYRAGDSGDHGSGRAVDIMVSGDPGWAIARYVQAHARELHVTYVIYQQKIWLVGKPTSTWRPMEDRGSRTANHYDHVHVSVS